MSLKKLACSTLIVGLIAGGAFALPVLQLDISNGIYNRDLQSTVNTTNQFDVIALLGGSNYINDNFFLSIAVTPKQALVNPAPDYGYFTIDGQRIDVTEDMVWGSAPIDNFVNGIASDVQGWDKGDIQDHGIYDTYFTEVGFKFDASKVVGAYNVQTGKNESGTLLSKSFTVDLSGLDPNIGLHFDLYNEKFVNASKREAASFDINTIAPFSKDLDTKNVPEPSILSLFGLSLLGLGFIRRKRTN